MKGKVIEPKKKGFFSKRKMKEVEEETEEEEEEEIEEEKEKIIYLTPGEASILQKIQSLEQQVVDVKTLIEENI